MKMSTKQLTVKDLNKIIFDLEKSEDFESFFNVSDLEESEFIQLVIELLSFKLVNENKQRKKRVLKFLEKQDPNQTVEDIKEYLEGNIKSDIQKIFSSKKNTIENPDFFIKDLKEFFNLYAPETILQEVISNLK